MGFAPLSIPVAPAELAQHLDGRRFVYLISVADSRSHVVALVPDVDDERVTFASAGNTTRRDIANNPVVTLVWPPSESSEYSLVADGRAVVDGDGVRVTVEKAVLHRPARSTA